jgi:N-acyl-phosphatidylethanolamine-hydrolysing phospholipase D
VPAFAFPRAAPDQLTATWIGHSSFLIQIGGHNILVDPVWGERASPIPWLGPRRWTPPGVRFDALPPIDAVVLSHDHYDHLDAPTIRRLVARPGGSPAPRWYAPLGVGAWLAGRGAHNITELDWWQATEWIDAPGSPSAPEAAPAEPVRLVATPAQHFSGRSLRNRNQTLWCGWTLRSEHKAIWFVGDTGRHPVFEEIGRRLGPFDAILMPIGAYDPEWFMGPVHINPENAVAAYMEASATTQQNGAAAVMVGMHWGTFKLTDEPMDEPPARARRAWTAAGLPDSRLWIPRHGETRVF